METPAARDRRVVVALAALAAASPVNAERLAAHLDLTPADVRSSLDRLQQQPDAATAPAPSKKAYDPKAARVRKFVPETRAIILDFIGKGAFLHVAAQAAGIGMSTFKDWLRDTRPEFVEFQRDVAEAHAHARASKEIQVYDEDPVTWLRYAARDRGDVDAPGWSEVHKIQATVERAGRLDLASLGLAPEILRVILDKIREQKARLATTAAPAGKAIADGVGPAAP